jgi:hypothetical protein
LATPVFSRTAAQRVERSSYVGIDAGPPQTLICRDRLAGEPVPAQLSW